MKEGLVIVNDCLLIAVVGVGILRYMHLETTFKTIVWLMSITACVELSTQMLYFTKGYLAKNTIFHTFSIVELTLITIFFLRINQPRYYKNMMIATLILWPAIGILNTAFLQPIAGLNTNIIVIESFAIITMCLASIYLMLKSDTVGNIFLKPHFQMCVIWLIQWSSTFFFWAFISVLYKNHWSYMTFAMDMNTVINFITNAAIGAVLLYYPKTLKTFENN